MVDWAEIVRVSVPDLPKNEAKQACSDHAGRNKGGVVGTKSRQQTIDLKRNTELCSDVPTVPTVPTIFECSRVEGNEKCNPMSFNSPDGDDAEGLSAPAKAPHQQTCRSCTHLARPGLSDGLCGGRSDLPPAFGPGHPLRQLPADHGADCPTWALHECW